MQSFFFLSLFLVFYCYCGYPLLLWIITRMMIRPVKKQPYEPTVSFVLSVWNEEDVIERKLQNILSIDYPKGKLDVLIGSDGSTDCTNEIIRRFAAQGVVLIENPERRGKMATLNDLVSRAVGDVVVFSDARQEFAPNAVRQLVANFFDPAVGCVSGELIFRERGNEGATAKGVGLYWKYEKLLRVRESWIHSMLGATGAIYAIRRELFEPIPADIVLDDVFVPMKIVQKGYRAIFDEAAKAYDEPADNPREEHWRKARTLYGNYQLFQLLPWVFNPWASPVAIQFFSHKFLRVVAPFLLIGMFFASISLADQPFFRGAAFLQILFYAMAVAGVLARDQKHGIFKILATLCYVPYVFCLLNFSALIGFFRFWRGDQKVAWAKARGRK